MAAGFTSESAGASPPAPRPAPRVPARLEVLVETATAYAKAASPKTHKMPTPRIGGIFFQHGAGATVSSRCPQRYKKSASISAPAPPAIRNAACQHSPSRRSSDVFPALPGISPSAALSWTEKIAGIHRKDAKPPRQKEAVLGDDLITMIATLGHDLRGLRDRAILLLGFAGGLRRSEIVGLDVVRDDKSDGAGWIEIFADKGVLVTLRGKTGWREVEVGRGSSDLSCPVVALETWIRLGRIARGPLFRRIFKDNKTVDVERLSDKHVARLVKQTALAAGVRADLPEGERALLFSGHSLRAGLASSAEIEERYVQKQLGHASAEMTRKYQRRRDRFRTNLTKASGL
jgi:integrase